MKKNSSQYHILQKDWKSLLIIIKVWSSLYFYSITNTVSTFTVTLCLLSERVKVQRVFHRDRSNIDNWVQIRLKLCRYIIFFFSFIPRSASLWRSLVLILTTFMEMINSSVYWMFHSIQIHHLIKEMHQGSLNYCIIVFWSRLCSIFLSCEL